MLEAVRILEEGASVRFTVNETSTPVVRFSTQQGRKEDLDMAVILISETGRKEGRIGRVIEVIP